MNLEAIIQSEVSQKEKDKYHMLTHIHGIQKDGTDDPMYDPICRATKETQTKNRFLESVREGEAGRI